MGYNRTAGNGSSQSMVQHWTYMPICVSFLTVFSISINATVITQYIIHKKLRTPFGILLLNLLSANLLLATITNPLRVISSLYPGWWIGYGYCTLLMYGLYVINLGSLLAHAAITANRLWAVAFPVSFRHRFSQSFAFGMCAVVWFLAHAINLPGVLLDAVYFRHIPLEVYGCFINAAANSLTPWMLCSQACNFVATLFILSAFPFIYYKEKQRSRVQGKKRDASTRLRAKNVDIHPSPSLLST